MALPFTRLKHAGMTLTILSIIYFLCNYCVFVRPNNAEMDKNKNGDDHEDGGVSSKSAAVGSVADFLRKEATSNYDFR